jgi:hypothetical protein
MACAKKIKFKIFLSFYTGNENVSFLRNLKPSHKMWRCTGQKKILMFLAFEICFLGKESICTYLRLKVHF